MGGKALAYLASATSGQIRKACDHSRYATIGCHGVRPTTGRRSIGSHASMCRRRAHVASLWSTTIWWSLCKVSSCCDMSREAKERI